MRVALLAVLASVSAALARAETYTLLHRSQRGAEDAPWAVRALVNIEDAHTPAAYKSLSEWFEAPRGDAAYQLKLVPGDVSDNSAAQLAQIKGNYPTAFTPECHLYTGHTRRDQLGIYLSNDRPVALSFSVAHESALDAEGCPSGELANVVETTIATFSPTVPAAPIRTKATTTAKTEDGKPVPPKPEKSLLQRYWYFIIPIIALMIMPAAEDVPDPRRPPNTGAVRAPAAPPRQK
ncbi:hypothetical protein MCUN1_000470 [Malassezia cuniculi]|uniref:ER membrane protein complex subunit 10 n=1 Tax=Malassezia cuniculi TaxID=948313 RepID=A0AAF0J4Q0_9BASI|nr:hypothetical protein MCUN1_000470 [Malassezia cuniculi]